jgi:hypothetical protein
MGGSAIGAIESHVFPGAGNVAKDIAAIVIGTVGIWKWIQASSDFRVSGLSVTGNPYRAWIRFVGDDCPLATSLFAGEQ